MVRAPCCEEMGLKKGPWTPEEDRILVSYIQRYGHDNWRALPKQAGLLRCGKSCRLRWTNYLRPDIKRGNFSEEEEESIIKLHQILGNRWSAIAARLPGRTDNEIKNFWHTHLKKKKKVSSADQNLATPTNIGHFFNDPISDYQFSSQLSSLESFVPFIKEEEEEEEARPASSIVDASSLVSTMEEAINDNISNNVSEDDMVFWYNLFMKTGESRLFSL